jgi:hypothetical protein
LPRLAGPINALSFHVFGSKAAGVMSTTAPIV